MWQKIVEKLRSGHAPERMRGWELLRAEFAARQIPVTAEQRLTLCDRLQVELNDEIRRVATAVLLALPHVPPAPVQAGREPSLADWLWNPFKKRSAVFGVSAPDFRLRDEPALIVLARHLNRHDFPETDIQLIRPEGPDWSRQVLEHRDQSLCLVGRLGLYGPAAVQRWKPPDVRFRFRTHQRPRSLPPGKLNKRYHCIVEQDGGEPPVYCPTAQRDGIRTDYGLVQRYPVYDGVRYVVVLLCAGGSALGTLAAAQWAAEVIAEPTHFGDDSLIGLAPGIGPDSHLEALIDVTAPETTHAWQPSHIQLRKLYVDRAVWSPEDRDWHIEPPKTITLLGDRRNVTGVLFDGRPAHLHSGSRISRLLIELCRQVHQQGNGKVDVTRLANNRTIWDGETLSERETRRRLSILKTRYLRDALTIGRDVRLAARVVRGDAKSA